MTGVLLVSFDDNLQLEGRSISGLPVLSSKTLLKKQRHLNAVELIVFNTNIGKGRRDEIEKLAESLDMKVIFIPNYQELISGSFTVTPTWRLDEEEMLGRPKTRLSLDF